MWIEIICGLVVFKIIRRFLYDDDDSADAFADLDTNSSHALFAVASRLEKIYGGKSYVGLRIPDPDSASRQHVDIVLVTKNEVMVVAVRTFSGFVDAGKDGNWVIVNDKMRTETIPDPVIEITRQVEILESYLEQRGVSLSKGHLISRVVLPNPNCRTAHSIDFQTEVIPFKKWTELMAESKTGFSNWIKDAFRGGGKGAIQDGMYQRLNSILSTAPMWDRLELKGDKNILGEFIEFKGNQEDMRSLGHLKRSKVSQFIIQKSALFFGRSRVQILYVPRDYRSEVSTSVDLKEVAVKPNTEFIFQPLNSKKARKFKVTSVASLTLSA